MVSNTIRIFHLELVGIYFFRLARPNKLFSLKINLTPQRRKFCKRQTEALKNRYKKYNSNAMHILHSRAYNEYTDRPLSSTLDCIPIHIYEKNEKKNSENQLRFWTWNTCVEFFALQLMLLIYNWIDLKSLSNIDESMIKFLAGSYR